VTVEEGDRDGLTDGDPDGNSRTVPPKEIPMVFRTETQMVPQKGDSDGRP
jgi:hypothetical protein